MACFIIIGIGNATKQMIDEIKKSHQSSHIVSTGTLLKQEGDNLYYEFTVPSSHDNKTSEKQDGKCETAEFDKHLSNHISHFKSSLPESTRTQIWIVAPFLNDNDYFLLKLTTQAIAKTKGTFLNPPLLNIILLGYDLSKSNDITCRPELHLCKEVYEYLNSYKTFNCKVLYINNQNLVGTYIDLSTHWVSRIIGNWADIVSFQPEIPQQQVHKKFYALGMAEHRYCIDELFDYFRAAAIKEIIDRRLDTTTPNDSAKCAYANDDIFTIKDWYDGLIYGKNLWRDYVEKVDIYGIHKYDYSKSLKDNEQHSLYFHKNDLIDALVQIVTIYKDLLYKEITDLDITIQTEANSGLPTDNDDADNKPMSNAEIKRSSLKEKLQSIEDFPTLEEISKKHLITSETISNIERFERLGEFFISDKGKKLLLEAIEKIGNNQDLIRSPFQSTLRNAGLKKQKSTEPIVAPPNVSLEIYPMPTISKKKRGFIHWIKDLFARIFKPNVSISEQSSSIGEREHIEEPKKIVAPEFNLSKEVENWLKCLSRICDTEKRYNDICRRIDNEHARRQRAIARLNEYKIEETNNSQSLIDMSKVHQFRANSPEFKVLIKNLLTEYFDKTQTNESRESEEDFINRIIISELKSKYRILNWDSENPFVDVNHVKSDDNLKIVIPKLIFAAKPFVDSKKLLNRQLLVKFFSNLETPTGHGQFALKYNLSDTNIVSSQHPDFSNTLCLVQVSLDVNPPKDIKDFVPKASYQLGITSENYQPIVDHILHNAPNDNIEKVKAIYDWLCENIKYDTTLKIHDADSCIKYKRGVCQAYCEVFLKLASEIGVPVEIVTGYAKSPDGKIPEEKHSWIFAFTDGYNGILVDPTWGAGTVSNGVFSKNSDTSLWFNVKPEAMIYSHYPENKEWIKLGIEISLAEFEKLPYRLPTEVDSDDTLMADLSNLKQ